MNAISWFEDLRKGDVPLVGGKGANLGEMIRAGIPVPPGFVVNIYAYSQFLEETGLKKKIAEILSKTNVNNSEELNRNTAEIRRLIVEAKMPRGVEEVIRSAYLQLERSVKEKVGGEFFVAVRSSATAEDVPEASFAGQQDTYLNVRGADEVVKHVQRCWASLFTARATFYRETEGFKHMDVYIAVVIQKMVNSTTSGVMFTSNPITGVEEALIEAIYGLGEAIVGGQVTPDTYVVERADMAIKSKVVSTQTWGYSRSSRGETIKVNINKDVQAVQKISDDLIMKITEIGNRIEGLYGMPMDVEWASEENDVYIVQARPVTTIKKHEEKGGNENDISDAEILVKGMSASPGFAAGTVSKINDSSELEKIKTGDVLVTPMTMPDMVPAMKRAIAIVTNEGGMTCHAAIVSRELGTPCIVGTGNATEVLQDGMEITVDATKGVVYKGVIKSLLKKKEEAVSKVVATAPVITATEVKVNIDFAEIADKAVATGADGVGLLRAEHMFINIGEHPNKLIKEGRRDELIKKIADEIAGVAEKFYPKPVWYRTLDAPTDEFRKMKGGEDEPIEHNPMLGWRGIRRSLDEVDTFKCELEAIKILQEDRRLTNIGVMLPMVQSVDEVRRAKEIAKSIGLEPRKHIEFGVMVETPAAAITIDEIIEEGIDFISFGTNDLTQYTLALDRNNGNVAKLYHETHPAVLKLIESVIKKCRKAGVTTSICGQAGSYPKVVEKLVVWGINSVSANIDAVQTIRETVARVEKKLLVDGARIETEEKEKI